MKLEYGTYIVSFNTDFNGYELGDTCMNSIDFTGDDVDALVKEVINDDPKFPMKYREGTNAIGEFYAADDEDYVVAILVRTACFI